MYQGIESIHQRTEERRRYRHAMMLHVFTYFEFISLFVHTTVPYKITYVDLSKQEDTTAFIIIS